MAKAKGKDTSNIASGNLDPDFVDRFGVELEKVRIQTQLLLQHVPAEDDLLTVTVGDILERLMHLQNMFDGATSGGMEVDHA